MKNIKVYEKGEWKEYPQSKIMYAEADDNYVNIYTIDGRKLTRCCCLKQLHSELGSDEFVRIHHKYVVNAVQIKCCNKKKFYCIVMNDNRKLPVSKRKRKDVRRFLKLF